MSSSSTRRRGEATSLNRTAQHRRAQAGGGGQAPSSFPLSQPTDPGLTSLVIPRKLGPARRRGGGALRFFPFSQNCLRHPYQRPAPGRDGGPPDGPRPGRGERRSGRTRTSAGAAMAVSLSLVWRGPRRGGLSRRGEGPSRRGQRNLGFRQSPRLVPLDKGAGQTGRRRPILRFTPTTCCKNTCSHSSSFLFFSVALPENKYKCDYSIF